MPDRALIIYDADGGVVGESKYFIRKWLGLGKCELCVVTHRGLKPRERWRQAVAALSIPVAGLHRNELDERIRAFVDGNYPSVLGERDGELGWILRPQQIGAYVGAPEKLAETIGQYFD